MQIIILHSLDTSLVSPPLLYNSFPPSRLINEREVKEYNKIKDFQWAMSQALTTLLILLQHSTTQCYQRHPNFTPTESWVKWLISNNTVDHNGDLNTLIIKATDFETVDTVTEMSTRCILMSLRHFSAIKKSLNPLQVVWYGLALYNS